MPPGTTAQALPLALSAVLTGAAYAAGRLLSRGTDLRSVAAGALAVGCLLAVVALPGGLSGDATAPPLDYGNANGALLTLGAAAAMVAALSRQRRAHRLLGVLGSAVFLPLTVLVASQAATVVTALLLTLGATLSVRPTAGRPVPAVGALVVLAALTVTTALALSGPRLGPVQEALSYQRVALWQEAVDMVERAPLRGLGVSSFDSEAPSAVRDRDVRWTHSLWLQQAAESGLPGLALLIVPAGIALLRVRADGWEDGGVPALGAAATTGMLLHGSIDYVFHFPVVLTLTALLAGLTLAPRRVV